MRRFAIGAEPLSSRGTHFRIWAPARRAVHVVERSRETGGEGPGRALDPEGNGYFSGLLPDLGPGMLYSLRLDGQPPLYPDPASRSQPAGVHGPSEVVDASAYAWQDANFRGPRERGQVIYELHLGTFTRAGTYAAAAAELAELARLGVTTIELMPVAEFPGRFGWGYDGVDLWAPTRLYGRPDDLRKLVDAAHANGLAIILDVVYNHLGPDGNYLEQFSPDYFTDRYPNEWGKSLNFDGPESGPVREFFAENARYWIEEYHFDGLRLDATQSMIDASERHVIAQITDAARSSARRQDKRIFITAENEPQEVCLVGATDQGNQGCDALWNDDFHHTARVALTGRREAYYMDYAGSPQELISALKWGYLYQGQHYYWQKKCRGQSALDLGATNFVTYLENHDQIANSLGGDRIQNLCSPAALRALTTLWLLSPPTPMLFQGQEFGATSPFFYFADHGAELSRQVREGRKDFLAQFPSVAAPEATATLRNPADPATFEACKLDFKERETNAGTYALHRDLLALRRNDPTFSEQRSDHIHGAVLAERAFLIRFLSPAGDRLIIVNLGADLTLTPAPEPLLAPRVGSTWKQVFSSEAVKYGGNGSVPPHEAGTWKLSANCASVLEAVELEAAELETIASETVGPQTLEAIEAT
jgi:maltooligosyltrehalose trehalohydrolase